MADAPAQSPELADLTVVILSLSGDAVLAQRVAALERQGCRVVAVPQHQARPPIPQLRMQALRDATTAFVGFLEDTATPGPDWCTAALSRLDDERIGAVSGPVTISPALAARYRALGLSEYAAFQPGRQPARVCGLDFAVRRSSVLGLYRPDESGLIEGEMADRLHRAGLGLGYAPGMAVTYDQAHQQGARLSTRFAHGRLYASARVGQKSLAVRLAYALGACLLPLILTCRSLAGGRASLAAAAWVLAMTCAWALGELTGYLFGASADGLTAWS